MNACRIAFLAAIVAHASLLAAQTRAPVPGAEAQAKAMALIKEVYKAEYDAANTPSQKELLAKKMLSLAQQAKALPERYAILRVARDFSMASGGTTCFQAVDEMAKSFQIDRLDMKAKVLAQCAGAARTSIQNKAISEAGIALVNQALAEGRGDLARQVISSTSSTARKSRDGALVKQTANLANRIDVFMKAYAEMKSAESALNANPADPGANLIVGKYYCFYKGDWAKGLPMLALSSDPVIKSLAEKELRGAAAAKDKIALADGWWALGEKESGLVKERTQVYAAGWYELAFPELSVLQKAKVQKRLTEARALGLPLAVNVPLSQAQKAPRDTMAGNSETKGMAKDFPIGKWVPLLTSPNKLVGWQGVNEKVKYSNGVIELNNTNITYPVTAKDMVIRAKVKKLSGQHLALYVRQSEKGCYVACGGGDGFSIGKTVSGKWVPLKKVAKQEKYDDGFKFSFAAIGDKLTVFVNRQPVIEIHDSTLTEGQVKLQAYKSTSLFRDVEIQISKD
jgi:hypothetical protein